ncbi:MAG: DUF2206 domain-containing protein [Chloroflexi bacterium]|nr:DUF2206 domain-containing protein [Chloroflexota bacterium]
MTFKKYITPLALGALVVTFDISVAFDVPVIRQIAGFMVLTFLPGALVLRVLRAGSLCNISRMLYAAGLSVAGLMLTGFLLNAFLPLVGVAGPLSVAPLLAAINILIFALLVIALKQGSLPSGILGVISRPRVAGLVSPPVLFSLTLPVAGVIAPLADNSTGSNLGYILLFVLIALAVVLAATGRIPVKTLPLTVMAISLALIAHFVFLAYPFHTFGGGDRGWEFYLSQLVITNSSWQPSLSHAINAMLAVTLLPPVYANLLGIGLDWVFKIIISLVYSLIPLALYQIYRRQISEKGAFLAVFFFMSLPVFFTLTRSISRQSVAELFFVLLLLLLTDKDISRVAKSVLSLVFGAGVVVSHYGITYILLFYMLFALAGLHVISRLPLGRFRPGGVDDLDAQGDRLPRTGGLSFTFVAFFAVFALGWYTYVSGSVNLATVLNLITQVYYESFDPSVAPGEIVQLAIGVQQPRPYFWVYFNAVVQHVAQFLIILGFLGVALKKTRAGFSPDFAMMILASFLVLGLYIVLPYLNYQFQVFRVFHLTLFFLSPLCILGAESLARWLSGLSRLPRRMRSLASANRLLLPMLIMYFLFYVGLVYELTDTPLASVDTPVLFHRFRDSGEPSQKEMYYVSRLSTADHAAVMWLARYKEGATRVYSDTGFFRSFLAPYPMPATELTASSDPREVEGGLIYLRVLNLKDGYLGNGADYYDTGETSQILNDIHQRRSQVYTNGGSAVLK